MRIEIASPQFSVTEAIRGHLEERIGRSLAHFESRIGRVRVGLADVNGPRRGNDKRCRIECHIESLCRVEVEAVNPDLYAAIDRAAEKLERAVERHLLKLRSATRHARPETA